MAVAWARTAAKKAVLALSRADWLTHGYRQPRLLVLCYHGVVSRPHAGDRFGYHNSVSPEEFQEQLEYLGRRFRFIDLAGLQAWLEQDRGGKPPVLITFDDGYRNNLTLGAPVLRRVGAPAVFFLATSHIGRPDLLWTEEIVLRVLSNGGKALPETPGLPAWSRRAIPAEVAARREMAAGLREALKKVPNAVRLAQLAALYAALPLDAALVDHELNDFLNWDEARELAAQGFDIGSHTVSHPILSRLEPRELEEELAGSKAKLEQELGRAVTSIAYPNGSRDDYGLGVLDTCRRTGYQVAFTVSERFHERGGEPLAIHRIAVPGHSEPDVFRFCASGLRDRLKRS